MTLTALQNAALARFAQQGFSATALAQIAADVGIKPPSIYAHFKSKEELFISLVEPTAEEELAYVRQALAKPGDSEKVLAGFLRNIERRFETAPMMRFLLHSAYLPPQQISGPVDKIIKRYMNSLDKIILEAFRQIPPGRLPPESLAAAFAGIVDSLQAEILYAGKARFRKRMEAMWSLFRLALSPADN
ncbi:TetR/AcrR family transcriptional regulator [Deltaproteobacteria bacterium OttesenSCG-928-M10]|nr:TetR/AcrR family transcriptional regulator [Deltaproteobacteria bacterium OttesenSCG-928-M10]